MTSRYSIIIIHQLTLSVLSSSHSPSIVRMNRPNQRFIPRLVVHSDWNKMRENLDRIDECINEEKECDRNSINLSTSSSYKGISPVITSSSHLPSNSNNIGWSSDQHLHPPSFSHQFATLRRPPSYKTEDSSSRQSYEEPSSFFAYPMQLQPMIHPQQSQHHQAVPYPLHNQMIPSMIPSSQPSFHPHISYNQSMIQSTEPQQMWCPSSAPPSYPLNPSQVVYFSPYTNPPAAFLPSKHDSLSDEDYDPFPSECSSLCCHGFTQLLWIILLIVFTSILGAFFLGLFSL